MSEDMGLRFVKGRVAKIDEKENSNLILRVENIDDGTIEEGEYDMVVLSVGLRPNTEIADVFKNVDIELDNLGFLKPSRESTNPVATSAKGVFIAGCTKGPKDIPDSVAEANAAAQAMDYLYEKAGVTVDKVSG